MKTYYIVVHVEGKRKLYGPYYGRLSEAETRAATLLVRLQGERAEVKVKK